MKHDTGVMKIVNLRKCMQEQATQATEIVYHKAEENQFSENGSCRNPFTSRNLICIHTSAHRSNELRGNLLTKSFFAFVWVCFSIVQIDRVVNMLCITSVICCFNFGKKSKSNQIKFISSSLFGILPWICC